MTARNPRGGAKIPQGTIGGYQREHGATMGAGVESMVPGHQSWAERDGPQPVMHPGGRRSDGKLRRCSHCGRESTFFAEHDICPVCGDGWMVEKQ